MFFCVELFIPNLQQIFSQFFIAAVVVVGCTTNDDCRQTEACFNRDCVDPCNCGTNAQCFVNNHKPVCFCPEGYTGDPEVGCVKGRTWNGIDLMN